MQHDWNPGSVRVLAAPDKREVRSFPNTYLVAPDGTTVGAWEGFAPPADLGLALRALIGAPSPDAPGPRTRRPW